MRHVEGNSFLKLDGLLMRIVSQPTVTVRLTGNAALASIYASNSVDAAAAKSNPFTGNADGSWDFYIPDTRYNVELTAGTPAISGTLVSSDQIAYDPFIHFSHSNLNSGYVYQQNSAGLATPVSVASLGLVLAGADYVRLNAVSSGTAALQYNPGSGVPVLDVVMTGTGWLQAWRTSSGHGGAQTLGMYLDNLFALYCEGKFVAPLGSTTAPTVTTSNGRRSGMYWQNGNIPALTASGGAMTMVFHPDSGMVLNQKTYIGNACGLTTSSAIITASKAFGLGDVGVTQVASTATNITFTLSANAGFAPPPGTVIPIFRAGAGTVTVTSGGAVTILGKQFTVNSLSGASLEWIATDVWLLRA